MRFILDVIDYLHHSIVLTCAFLSHTPLPSPTWQTRHLLPLQRFRQWHWHCLLWHLSPPSFLPILCSSFHSTKLLHSPDEQLSSLISLAGSFGYIAPEVIKNTGKEKPVDIWSTGMIASTHIHKQNAGSLLSFSAQPLSPTFPSTATPLSVPTTPRPLPSKILIPKLNFRVRTRISFLMKPSPLSDVSPPSIYSIVVPRGSMWPLVTPIPPSPPLPLHVDLSLDVITGVEQSGTAPWPA